MSSENYVHREYSKLITVQVFISRNSVRPPFFFKSFLCLSFASFRGHSLKARYVCVLRSRDVASSVSSLSMFTTYRGVHR